jgi:hypothetical protein
MTTQEKIEAIYKLMSVSQFARGDEREALNKLIMKLINEVKI